MTEEVKGGELLSPHHNSGTVVAEAALTAAAVGGVAYAMTKLGLDLKDQFVIRPDAKPSDTLITAFDVVGTAAPYVAGVSLAVDRFDSLRHGMTRPRRALKEISNRELADNERKSEWGRFAKIAHRVRKDGRAILGLAIVGGLTAGFYNTAVEISDSQRRVPAAFAKNFGVAENSSVLCQSDTCSQANSNDLPKSQTDKMVLNLSKDGINAVALRQDYYSASSVSASGKNIKTVQSIVYGLPGRSTDLLISYNCTNIHGYVDTSLGVRAGEKVIVNGLPITVAESRNLSAGQNLVPIVINYEDVSCLKNQNEPSYSFVIAETDSKTLQKAAENVGLNIPEKPRSRTTAVNLEKYLNNSQELGDVYGKPLILTVIAAFGMFALNGLMKDERFRSEKARTVIATLKTQNYTDKEIIKTQSLRAGRLATLALVPMFMVAETFDIAANSGIVGSAQGTSLVSLALGGGLILEGSKRAARRATRKQLKSLSKNSALLQELK